MIALRMMVMVTNGGVSLCSDPTDSRAVFSLHSVFKVSGGGDHGGHGGGIDSSGGCDVDNDDMITLMLMMLL